MFQLNFPVSTNNLSTKEQRSSFFASLETELSFLAPSTFPKLPHYSHCSSCYSFRNQEDLYLLQSGGQAAVSSAFWRSKFLLQF